MDVADGSASAGGEKVQAWQEPPEGPAETQRLEEGHPGEEGEEEARQLSVDLLGAVPVASAWRSDDRVSCYLSRNRLELFTPAVFPRRRDQRQEAFQQVATLRRRSTC